MHPQLLSLVLARLLSSSQSFLCRVQIPIVLTSYVSSDIRSPYQL